jgi:hypothetical protein
MNTKTPVDVFINFGSEIHFVEVERRQRKPRSAEFKNAWSLILQWAARGETCVCIPVKFGEADRGVIPSQAAIVLMDDAEGVET